MKYMGIVFIVLIFTLSAFADEPGLIIKTEMTSDVMGFGGTKSNSIQFFTADKSREESRTSAFGMSAMLGSQLLDSSKILIKDFNERLSYNVDPGQNQYSVIDLDTIGRVLERQSSMEKYDIFQTEEQKQLKEQLQDINWVTNIDSTDTLETINGFPCRKYIYTTSEENDTSGFEYVSEIWFYYEESIDPLIKKQYSRINEESTFQESLNSVVSNPLFGPMTEHFRIMYSKIANDGVYPIYNIYEMRIPTPETDSIPTGDEISAYVDSLYGDDPLKANMFNTGITKFMKMMTQSSDKDYTSMLKITTETTEIISTTLNDSLFTIPKDFTEVGSIE